MQVFVGQLHQTNYQFFQMYDRPNYGFSFVYGQTKSDLRFARLVEQLVRWTAPGKSLGLHQSILEFMSHTY